MIRARRKSFVSAELKLKQLEGEEEEEDDDVDFDSSDDEPLKKRRRHSTPEARSSSESSRASSESLFTSSEEDTKKSAKAHSKSKLKRPPPSKARSRSRQQPSLLAPAAKGDDDDNDENSEKSKPIKKTVYFCSFLILCATFSCLSLRKDSNLPIDNDNDSNDDDDDYVFGIERAPHSRSSCFACQTGISAGVVRIKKMDRATKLQKWFHLGCFGQRRTELGWMECAEKLAGFEALSKDDQNAAKQHIPKIQTGSTKHDDDTHAISTTEAVNILMKEGEKAKAAIIRGNKIIPE